MNHVSVLMFRCPNTGRELNGHRNGCCNILNSFPTFARKLKCPVCNLDHIWSTSEAWLGNPAPSAPALAWLFINNRSAEND